MALYLTEDQVEEMIRHAQREYPNEACGLLAGRDSRVEKVYQMTNAEHSPVTYRLDPEEQFRAFMEIKEAGWELLAIYHSHGATAVRSSCPMWAVRGRRNSWRLVSSSSERVGWAHLLVCTWPQPG